MKDVRTHNGAAPSGKGPTLLLTALLFASALVLTLWSLSVQLPIRQWPDALGGSDPDIASIVWREGALPRLAVSWLAGLALGVAGALFQQVLRNPLAEPSTLGVSAGAQLALVVGTLLAPNLMNPWGREVTAFAGAALALLLVLSLVRARLLATTTLVLAGLIVTFYAGSLSSLLVIFNHDYLQTIFIWGSGSLVQNGWDNVLYLLPSIAGIIGLIALMHRSLALLDLGEEAARGLGLHVGRMRLLGLVLATILASLTVSAVGVVGFVGLAAPALVRQTGIRRFSARLVWSAIVGCVLLWLSDQIVQAAFGSARELVPTGAMTALLGGPLLIYLMHRLKTVDINLTNAASTAQSYRVYGRPLLWLASFLLVLLLIALLVGRDSSGWHWASSGQIETLLPWRWPRVTAALAAGLMLGVTGALLQRLTGNPMASPEVLGLSSGVAIGIVVLLTLPIVPSRPAQLGAGALGGCLAMLLLLLLGRRSDLAPEQMLLGGVAIGTAMSALTSIAMASGDPRMSGLLTWLAGSTWSVDPQTALLAIIAGVVGTVGALGMCRWLDILPLGPATAQTLGLPLVRARLLLVALAALLTATATLLVGPLSFVGLMAPHMARFLGGRLAWRHLCMAGLLGAAIMVAADWLGRMILFPYEIPAGLVATLIGTPYLLWLLRQR
ncbi:iron complex transport system permease protein [Arboricoccus pini]|uniref:Iron complex transport system permease protein n=1 Tax=Arboricoccus pini TaxID=1963835 RepID=A0A212R504_9PROT|nr:Fe(3+)-hydroxamate ABC transporter permease FhuB [Arboricoccus pini]SNB67112.1 iron complex transport system permease protein [Arboricoccus pini]